MMRLLTAVIVIVALVAAAEVAFRVYRLARYRSGYRGPWVGAPPKALAFQSHPYLRFVKRPHSDGLCPSNSLGYTGKREFSRAKPPNAIRIYCIGDSTTDRHDWRTGPDTSWPAQLEDLLTVRFPGIAIECINAAASGYTSAEFVAEFIFRGIDLDPDLVLVFPGVNDALTCQMIKGFRSDYSHVRMNRLWMLEMLDRIPKVPYLWTYQLARRWVMSRFGNLDSILWWVSAPPPWDTVEAVNPEAVRTFQRNIAALVAVAAASGRASALIKYEPDWQREPDRLYYLGVKERIAAVYFEQLLANNEALQEVARRLGCRCLDVGPFDSSHFSDTVHFNALGLAVMAQRVAVQIEPLVAQAAVSRGLAAVTGAS